MRIDGYFFINLKSLFNFYDYDYSAPMRWLAFATNVECLAFPTMMSRSISALISSNCRKHFWELLS